MQMSRLTLWFASAPLLACTSFSSTPAGNLEDAAPRRIEEDAGPVEIKNLGSSIVGVSSDVRTSVTLPAIPMAQEGDLVYVFLIWLTSSKSVVAPPAGWTLKDAIDDGFEGRGASFYQVVPAGARPKEYDFPLPTSARAGGLLVTYRGVFPPPNHVVADRAQSLTTNASELDVPGLSINEPGRLLLVLASTYDDPKTPLEIRPSIQSVASVGRLAAFEASTTSGQTGTYTVRDSFVALRATLTFATILRPMSPP